MLSQEINCALEGILLRLGTSPGKRPSGSSFTGITIKAHLSKDVAGKLGGSAIARINNYF